MSVFNNLDGALCEATRFFWLKRKKPSKKSWETGAGYCRYDLFESIFGVSPKEVYERFKEAMGITPYNFTNRCGIGQSSIRKEGDLTNFLALLHCLGIIDIPTMVGKIENTMGYLDGPGGARIEHHGSRFRLSIDWADLMHYNSESLRRFMMHRVESEGLSPFQLLTLAQFIYLERGIPYEIRMFLDELNGVSGRDFVISMSIPDALEYTTVCPQNEGSYINNLSRGYGPEDKWCYLDFLLYIGSEIRNYEGNFVEWGNALAELSRLLRTLNGVAEGGHASLQVIHEFRDWLDRMFYPKNKNSISSKAYKALQREGGLGNHETLLKILFH
ncbi:hypothetical protein ACFL24_02110 [Patescibacteria group bacterium]